MELERLKNYLHSLEKDLRGSNYWLRFDIRKNLKKLPLTNEIDILDGMYREVAKEKFQVFNSNFIEFSNIVESCISYNDKSKVREAKRLIRLTLKVTGENDLSFFKVTCDEDDHPTPGIFWDFWFLIINKKEKLALAISGGACD